MLYVGNLDSSIAFYSRAFDLEVTQRITSLTVTRPDGSTAAREVKMAFLKFPGQEFVFELAERKVPDDGISPVFQHVGVDVKDIEAAAERVKAAGGEGFNGIAVVEAQGVRAKTAFFKGPDGENVELMQIVSGTF
jgi:predicted enzyme related to lactoylglutathione lyase